MALILENKGRKGAGPWDLTLGYIFPGLVWNTGVHGRGKPHPQAEAVACVHQGAYAEDIASAAEDVDTAPGGSGLATGTSGHGQQPALRSGRKNR